MEMRNTIRSVATVGALTFFLHDSLENKISQNYIGAVFINVFE
jgi:hypothetical protein